MISIAFVPPNITVSQENLVLCVEYVSTQQANLMEVTTITDKNVMFFDLFHHSYSSEPWMNIIFTIECRCVAIANYQQHPSDST
jgi:hypothetical protein